MALAPLLYNITFDSQTRILYFWDKAGHEIYHCEIPSPAPALPTVITKNGAVGTESSKGTIATLANNASCYLWVYNSSSSSYELFTYNNTSHIPCCARISDSSGINTMWYGFSAEFTQSGNIKITNKTGSTYTNALGALCKICASPDATVITVYNSSNNPYNAFKYTSDGTDYYYVLDGTQTDWTDDLSSIGYHMIYTAWLKADHTIKSFISETEWYDLYDDDGQLITSGFPDPFTSHSFIVINAYRGDDVVTCTFNQFDISTGHLEVNMNVGGHSVQYITYIVSPTA